MGAAKYHIKPLDKIMNRWRFLKPTLCLVMLASDEPGFLCDLPALRYIISL
jgi:hypothetical protein